MELIVLGSSSRGNCYLLRGVTETLVLEAGIKFRDVLHALDYDISSVRGCLVTHEHGDHSNYVKDFLRSGVNIYSSRGTLQALKILPSYRIKALEPFEVVQFGGFTVLGFPVSHDAREPFGFLINHKECGRIAFITDTNEVSYSLPGLNNLIIEANFDEEIVDKSSGIPESVKRRIKNSHMDIEELKYFLSNNDTGSINNVVLIHLSKGNSDRLRFQDEIRNLLPGKQVWIAEPGLKIPLNVRPF